MPNLTLERAFQSLKPAAVLDVGCGCGGHSTRTLLELCDRVVAIDVAPRLARWHEIAQSSKARFSCMDALALGFPRDAFPLVVESAALHHIARWPEVLTEMLRVSSDSILLQEPLDDLRSAAKQRTFEAQGLFLSLQAEVGVPHYLHLTRDAILLALEGQAVIVETRLETSDAPVSFDEFFESFDVFASQSGRKEYWLDKLQTMRSKFAGAPLCEDDTLTMWATKRTTR
ncbi:MAG: methyltransferase domain-containing protein [candidate division Zixibacteria bacterium]|nr:methyltransferase domain-containing protein [candidate division Zixibacteria bacterium]